MTDETDEQAGLSDRQRKVIHIDMDVFYASVEQRYNPDLRGTRIGDLLEAETRPPKSKNCSS